MKRLTILFLLSLCLLSIRAQDNLFILVDVSKSVQQSQLNDAKQALSEVLTGVSPSKAFVSQGKQQDLANFQIKQGDKLSISKFGSLKTTLTMNIQPTTIQNISADVNQVLNSISWTPTDGQTYMTLAKAKIAEYAKNHNISKYKLYIISDNINDDYGPNGRPAYPDDNYTQNLVEGYNTSTNPIGEQGYTKLKFNANSDFTLSFSPGVDVSGYALPPKPTITPVPPAPTPTPTDTVAVIKISSPIGKKKKEYNLKNSNVTISWTCTNCPQGIKYTVNLSGYDGTKSQKPLKNLMANSVSTRLPDGKYRVSVSASNYQASSDTTYISVSTGGYGWLIFLLILIAGGGIGYYFWNKSRQEKIDSFTKDDPDDIFSQNMDTNNPNTTNYSSNNDYF